MFIKGAALQGFAWKSHCRLLQHEQMWIGAERDVVKNEKGSFQIKCKGKKHNTYCHFPLKFCSHSELTFFFFFSKSVSEESGSAPVQCGRRELFQCVSVELLTINTRMTEAGRVFCGASVADY